jgi:hypothetical protein
MYLLIDVVVKARDANFIGIGLHVVQFTIPLRFYRKYVIRKGEGNQAGLELKGLFMTLICCQHKASSLAFADLSRTDEN